MIRLRHHIQKMTIATRVMVFKKVWAQRSYRAGRPKNHPLGTRRCTARPPITFSHAPVEVDGCGEGDRRERQRRANLAPAPLLPPHLPRAEPMCGGAGVRACIPSAAERRPLAAPRWNPGTVRWMSPCSPCGAGPRPPDRIRKRPRSGRPPRPATP